MVAVRTLRACCWLLSLSFAAGVLIPPDFTVSLDLPAKERWSGAVDLVLTHHTFGESFGPAFLEHNRTLFSNLTFEHYAQLADGVKKYFPEQAEELEGISTAFRSNGHIVTFEYLSAWVYFHELAHTDIVNGWISPECTGIVTQDRYGNLVHGRNMDQTPRGVRNITLSLTFTKNDSVQFQAVDWYWFTTGVVTANKRGLLSIQENWRFSDPPLSFDKVLATINSGVLPQVFVFRYLLLSWVGSKNSSNFKDSVSQTFLSVVDYLCLIPLAAPYYVVVVGTRSTEAVVLTRSPSALDDITWLDTSTDWLLVQTNYDRDVPDPPDDNRRTIATNLLRELGQVNGATTLGVYAVISSFPVKNVNTAYTAIMSAATGQIQGYIREPMLPASECEQAKLPPPPAQF